MSRQISDTFIFRNQKYSVCGREGPALLDMARFGLETVMMHTACYRGYIAAFSIYENALVLVDLQARVSNKTAPEISGVQPEVEELPGGECRELHYRNIKHKLSYSGGLLTGRNYIQRFNRSRLFAHPFEYKKVIRLQFDNGLLLRAIDISPLVASVSGGIKKMEQQGIMFRDHDLLNYWFEARTNAEWQEALQKGEYQIWETK